MQASRNLDRHPRTTKEMENLPNFRSVHAAPRRGQFQSLRELGWKVTGPIWNESVRDVLYSTDIVDVDG